MPGRPFCPDPVSDPAPHPVPSFVSLNLEDAPLPLVFMALASVHSPTGDTFPHRFAPANAELTCVTPRKGTVLQAATPADCPRTRGRRSRSGQQQVSALTSALHQTVTVSQGCYFLDSMVLLPMALPKFMPRLLLSDTWIISYFCK